MALPTKRMGTGLGSSHTQQHTSLIPTGENPYTESPPITPELRQHSDQPPGLPLLGSLSTFLKKRPLKNSLLSYLNQHIPKTQSDRGGVTLSEEVRGQPDAREGTVSHPRHREGNAGKEMAPLQISYIHRREVSKLMPKGMEVRV